MTKLSKILWHYGQTKYLRKFHNRSQLESWQDHQVQQFLKKILPQSSFYRHHYANYSLADWQNFPLIDKATMMANFDHLNTVGIHKSQAFDLALTAERSRNFSPTLNGYTIGLSSGTSGHRGLFVVSPTEQQAWTGTILAKALPKPLWANQKIALFLRANSPLYETVNQRRIQFKYFDLMHPIHQHLQQLNTYQPDILVAPPSLLRILAAAQTNKTLTISPTKILSVAEVLDPLDNHIIQTAFQQIVHQLYQCTEGFLGSTCEYGTLHLNEDNIVIQKDYLDPQSGKFSPIITDFRRTSQPIIRYRLDDILTERPSPCPCGSIMTSLEHIEGRQDDIFYLPAQNRQEPIVIFPDFIRRSILLASNDITEYRVAQVHPTYLKISLTTPSDNLITIQAAVSKQLTNLFHRMQAQSPQIEYSAYQPHTQHHQKLRRIERLFPVSTTPYRI